MALAVAGTAPVAVAQEPAQQPEPAGYSDVAGDAYYYEAVNSLAAAGVYAGTDCGPNQLCPSRPLKRWEMAVWLVRALDGTEPAPAGSGRFADVEVDEWWLPYVERLADLEITGGCRLQPLRYCPDRAVTRAEMATFLTRAFDLPAADPAGFTDVADGNVHRDNINRLAAAEITGGCRLEPLQYCPQQPVSRAQMSVFIHRGLQWRADNQATGTRRGPPTPVLITNDTDEFITEENDFSRYILKNIIEVYEDRQPWLRAVWNHTNRADFTYLSADGHGTAVYYGNRMGEGDVIPRSTAVVMTAHPSQLSWGYNGSHVHELAHVYTDSNRIVADPAPIAAGHLYFSELARGGERRDCLTHELYAETAETLIFSRYATQRNWVRCPTVPDKVTDEAIEVVRQAFSGQMPDWFHDTFQDPSGNWDYEAIWAAVGRVRARSQLAVINQLRYSFGGYCSEADVLEEFLASEGSFAPGQPWVDGGCDDG